MYLHPRLLSGTAQSVRIHVLLAVVHILVDTGELSAWSSGCKRQCTPLVEGRVCVCGVAFERRGQEHHGKSPANEDTCHRW